MCRVLCGLSTTTLSIGSVTMTVMTVHSQRVLPNLGALWSRIARLWPQQEAAILTESMRTELIARLRNEQIEYGKGMAEFAYQGHVPPTSLVDAMAHNRRRLFELGAQDPMKTQH